MEKAVTNPVIEEKKTPEDASHEEMNLLDIAVSYRPRIIAYVRTIAKSEDVEDIVQESLEKVFKKHDTFRGESNFSSWVFRIVSNTVADYYRKRKETTTEDGFFENLIDEKADSPEQLVNAEEAKSCMIEKVNTLPEKDSYILYLYYFEKMNLQDIANQFKTTLSSAKVRLHRARKKIKNIMLHECKISFGCDGVLKCEEK